VIRIKRIDHVALSVDNVAETAAFYVDVLGLAPVPTRKTMAAARSPDFFKELESRTGTSRATGGLWLQLPGSQVHMIKADSAEGRANPFGPHVAYEVDNFDEAKGDLDGRGLGYVEAPDGLPFRQLWLLDPSGNTVELWAPRVRTAG